MFSVAIYGTEGFDVMSIDPITVKMVTNYCEIGVSPICWRYKDIGTTNAEPPEIGHSMRRDGYLDLLFYFDTQRVVTDLWLTYNVGETIALIIRGNLHDGTSTGYIYEGQDNVSIFDPSS